MKNRSVVPTSIDETTRPETDYEHTQRFLNDIDRSTWRGVHPPTHPGPHGVVHKLSIASNVPQIYKAGT